jgi:hypothetical protein
MSSKITSICWYDFASLSPHNPLPSFVSEPVLHLCIHETFSLILSSYVTHRQLFWIFIRQHTSRLLCNFLSDRMGWQNVGSCVVAAVHRRQPAIANRLGKEWWSSFVSIRYLYVFCFSVGKNGIASKWCKKFFSAVWLSVQYRYRTKHFRVHVEMLVL